MLDVLDLLLLDLLLVNLGLLDLEGFGLRFGHGLLLLVLMNRGNVDLGGSAHLCSEYGQNTKCARKSLQRWP